MKPDYISECGRVRLYCGDCLDVLPRLTGIHACVTDPPYGLSFMGKKWDYDVPSQEIWQAVHAAILPGAHLLAFAGTRTQHRMAVRIEDAGFEIRDMIAWVYGSGFPKSADVSKHLDAHAKKAWLNVCKALDETSQSAILDAWKEYSNTASNAGLLFAKSETATGTNTPKSDFVPALVALQANQKSKDALAVIAELSLSGARHTTGGSLPSVQSSADGDSMASSGHAITAGLQPENHEATLTMADSSALQSAWGWQSESTAGKLKAVEALKTWLGSKPSSRRGGTVALCAALTADLKRITLSQSETFQNFDTTRQTDCASAISVTITESTAGCLISFMADTLRKKAIDKAAGAEREVVGNGRWNNVKGSNAAQADCLIRPGGKHDETAPATEAAREWEGWGTALKPALEPITVARKPFPGTVAANVLEHGTGGLNVDGCRVGGTVETWPASRSYAPGQIQPGGKGETQATGIAPEGRWPANLIHDGSDEVVGLFPETRSGGGDKHGRKASTFCASTDWEAFKGTSKGGDSGTAARFFYTAKASKADRDEGCEGLEARQAPKNGSGLGRECSLENRMKENGDDQIRRRNHHPTVKPTALMRYLCRLVTPPGGVVLDPFMGSGSTGKAAIREGFCFVGIEKCPESFAIAVARIKAELVQGDLFHTPRAVTHAAAP